MKQDVEREEVSMHRDLGGEHEDSDDEQESIAMFLETPVES